MSTEDWDVMMQRLEKQYSFEYVMVQEIAKKFNKLRREVSPKYKLSEDETSREVILGVNKLDDGTPVMQANEEGVLLLAAISEVVVEFVIRTILSEKVAKTFEEKAKVAAKEYLKQAIPPLTAQSFKRCPKCNLDNDSNAKFCKSCGRKLE